MHLKSLVLKGFKSFADRCVLTMEPGITAIVGPNGSGKSNISDAVLWVLGERSAKNLRGQAMEDIIFSGSAARKAVSVAEVELVLDNSDGTIPVEYDEVSIARRMYRSGESEYLVNGAIVRRLDVLDILHDSGLGTGTHSIISQGSLDSVLQSKPEDRRALIEEAAGVLKHKQRKEKSARKIEAMDHHLARARDVAAEIERQLRPLERKAKRAEAYKEAKGQFDELKLALAVDDLRSLQEQWERVCAQEARASETLDSKRQNLAQAESAVSKAQEAVRRESEDAGELARKQRRSSQIADRLDSCELLLRERKRSAADLQSSLALSLESNASRIAAAREELDRSRARSSELDQLLESSGEAIEELERKATDLAEQRGGIESSLRECESELKGIARELDAVQRRKSNIQENLSSSIAREKLVEARRHELASDVDREREAHEAATAALRETEGKLAELEQHAARMEAESVSTFEQREQARKQVEDEEALLRMNESELRTVKNALEADRSSNEALSWLANQQEILGTIEPIVHSIRAPQGIEALVEHLIGEDINAIALKDGVTVEKAVELVSGKALAGDVSLLPGAQERAVKRASAPSGTSPISELVESTDGSHWLVDALLGDVMLCETRAEAFAAHRSDASGLRFASKDGCVIWPSGKVRVYGAPSPDAEGMLARERRSDELAANIAASRTRLAQLVSKRDEAEEAYREAQANSLRANQDLANQKGIVSAARSDEQRASQRLAQAIGTLEDIVSQYDAAKQAVLDLRPQMDETSALTESLEERIKVIESKREELELSATPLREHHDEVSRQLSEAKLERASLEERAVYARRMVSAREHDVESILSSEKGSRRSIAEKQVAIDRATSAIRIVESLAASLRRKTELLDEAIQASENAADGVHAVAAKARADARRAHDELDGVTEDMTRIRIEKSRLEVQVDAAVKAVVADCATPLDKAQLLPGLADRATAEDELFKLERRIKNMGAINPDAAEEYAALKERYDYLAGQLADMEEARRALRKIVTAIDARMKDDFARTFETVNANFSEVFSTLFPGGTASLVLEDPDDIENSGVEVTAQPRGKRLSKMMLMSGGEKSLTALALLFAVYKTRTTPFYILDEVEAALDDTNLRRLMSYIDTLRLDTQLIMITHQRRTMEMADVLFGVSMQADGVTKVISQKLERALEQAD